MAKVKSKTSFKDTVNEGVKEISEAQMFKRLEWLEEDLRKKGWIYDLIALLAITKRYKRNKRLHRNLVNYKVR